MAKYLLKKYFSTHVGRKILGLIYLGGLPRKYPSILNIWRTGRVALM
jgi:hypothetical protein